MITERMFACGLMTIIVSTLCLSALAERAPNAKQSKPLNVVFIVCDDLNNRLGCYGYKEVQTPNLDRLAADGIRFDNFYCQYPVCNPSRSSFLTGLRPETTKVLSNLDPMRKKLPEVITLPQCFKEQGYWTAVVNKFFHDPENDGERSWNACEHFADERNPVIEKARREFEAEHGLINLPENRQTWKKKQKSLRSLAGGQTPPGYGPTDMKDKEQGDGKAVRQIIEWLDNKAYGNKPFFIGWGVKRPHIPHFVPQKYFDLYPLESFRFAPQPPNDLKDVPRMAINNRYKLYGDSVGTDETRRKATAAYYACVTFIDTQVGLLLEALKRLDLMDETIILFTGDHGYLLGEHGLWEKAMLFEESARIPLIMRVPGKTKPDSVCTRLVEFVDLYPTLAELCGVKPPDNLEGLSFAPLLTKPDRPWKLGAFTMITHGQSAIGRSVRDQKWRYTEWGDPEINELYDHVNDPHEYTNLAKNPQYAEQVRQMRTLLQGSWQKALPPRE